MQITFDTTTITDDEVRGIFALLDTVRPEALASSEMDLSVLAETVNEYSTWVNENSTKLSDSVKLAEEPVSTFDGEEFPQSPVPPTHDANGLPWDERIHASSKALNADGTWRTKRGVDKALVERIEQELSQTPVAVIDNPPNDDYNANAQFSSEKEVSVVGIDPLTMAAQVLTPPAPPAPPVPTAPLAPSATVAPTPPATSTPDVSQTSAISPFVALMKRVTTAQGSGKLTPARVQELLASIDKKRIMDLRADDEALATFSVLLDGEGV